MQKERSTSVRNSAKSGSGRKWPVVEALELLRNLPGPAALFRFVAYTRLIYSAQGIDSDNDTCQV